MLEQLRSSQAWQDTVNPPNTTPSGHSTRPYAEVSSSTSTKVSIQTTGYSTPAAGQVFSATGSSTFDASAAAPGFTTSSVASLLSQLQASPNISAIIASGSGSTPQTASALGTTSAPSQPPNSDPVLASNGTARKSATQQQDLRECTFQQSLPYLARLSEDPDFVDAIRRVCATSFDGLISDGYALLPVTCDR